jgi:hypothetical protein
MEKIYIQKKGKVITGPYAVEHLQQHQIQSTDKVWYEGLSEWKRPQQIDFLRRHISTQNKQGFFARIFK